MNGAAGFREVRSSSSRSPSYRLLGEQRFQFVTGSQPFLRTHVLIAFSTDNGTKSETVPGDFPRSLMGGKHRLAWLLIIMMFLFFVSPVLVIAEEPIYSISPSDLSVPYKASLPFDPIPIGCRMVDCCPDCQSTGNYDWHIKLEGDLAESVTLQFDNIPHDPAHSITLRGNIEPVDASPLVYRVMNGESDVLGLSGPVQARTLSSSMQRLESFMKADTDHWPTGTIKEITFNQQKLKQLQSFPADHRRNKELGTIQVVISQLIGKTTVGKSKFHIDWRRLLTKLPDSDPSDRVDLPLKLGTGNSDNAVIMIDGRRNQGWTNDEIFRDSGAATALVRNYLTDDKECKESPSDQRQCHSEVTVFEKYHALRLDTPVSIWTDQPLDIHTTSAWTQPVTVPVKMWVLWEHANSTTSETTEDLAKIWIQKANDLYNTTRCGIQFSISGSITNKVQEASTTPIGNEDRNLDRVTCEDREISQLKQDIGFMQNMVNVYFTADVPGTERGWTCNPDLNVILIRTLAAKASDQTLAHELGHTLSLEHVNELDEDTMTQQSVDYNADGTDDFDAGNLMWGGGLTRDKVSLGQCFRCNVNSWSTLYRNNTPNAVLSGKPPRDCFDPTDNFSCPWLGRSE